ncbi:hypothetical protein HHK36_027447 [Tetracentron sinense]|uniref:U-box domain-containing protein n=1 Tax=Tetracentron sinense TaxID=13715 RepID=A0A834YJ56_TETSI|nr:hypothetical protein HHK36_027447 [Tetracentron sinense]
MKDPVTISTGMTYDRETIQKWLFSYNHCTCPVTKQLLTDYTLTPNSTLLRLIQSWSFNNIPKFSPKIEPPKFSPKTEPPKFSDVLALLNNLMEEVREPNSQMKSLRKIKSLIQENDYIRTFMEDAGITSVLASLITETNTEMISQFSYKSVIIEEAMTVLHLLKPSTETLKKISQDRNGLMIGSLSSIIQQGKLKAEVFQGIAEILRDQNSSRATMAVLWILMEVMPFGRNRIKAVEAGVVSVLVELLAESNEKRSCEIMLGILKKLCGKAEGRSAFLAHPASVASVASKILRVSQIANDRAVMVLLLVCKFCKSSRVAQELMEVGGLAKLCMVMQVECSVQAKEKAKEILGFHLKAWNKSPCFPSYFIA